MYRRYNPNPQGLIVGDCAVRAVAKALRLSWQDAFILLSAKAMTLCDMPSANRVWSSVLQDAGFKRRMLPDKCPQCMTVETFCYNHPSGVYVLSADGHVVTAVDGDWFDSWDSRDCVLHCFYEVV